MVFLDENIAKITINRHFSKDCAKIVLHNRFTSKDYTFEDLQDVSDSSYFYEFEGLDLSNLIDGEYTLSLYDEEDVFIEEQLAVKGNYQKTIKSYDRKNNSRTVYER